MRRISACVQVTCPVPLMLINTLSLVNYFSTLLAGKEDKCFDLAVNGIMFPSYSLIELGSIWFTCCHPGLTVELGGDRTLGGTELRWCPKARPGGHPNTQSWGCPGARRELSCCSDLCCVSSHTSDTTWQLRGIK